MRRRRARYTRSARRAHFRETSCLAVARDKLPRRREGTRADRALAALVPQGLLVQKELGAFSQVLDPSLVQRPLTAIVGGAKISDKILVSGYQPVNRLPAQPVLFPAKALAPAPSRRLGASELLAPWSGPRRHAAARTCVAS